VNNHECVIAAACPPPRAASTAAINGSVTWGLSTAAENTDSGRAVTPDADEELTGIQSSPLPLPSSGHNGDNHVTLR
jgi:hypothetical protein